MNWKRFEDEKPAKNYQRYVIHYGEDKWLVAIWDAGLSRFISNVDNINDLQNLKLVLPDPIWWAEVIEPIDENDGENYLEGIANKENYEKAMAKFYQGLKELAEKPFSTAKKTRGKR